MAVYETVSAHVYPPMRRTIGFLVLFAGVAVAQSRPSGAKPLAPRDMLAAHNALRARVGVPPLVWSAPLAAHAQKWAASLLARNRFEHRPDSPYGENLFAISGAPASPAAVVGDWAAEARDYDHPSNSCHGVCGHYTQIVWEETKRVGCAVARGKEREVWVCSYDPPGNWVGRRPYGTVPLR